jgi:hypothetical protein
VIVDQATGWIDGVRRIIALVTRNGAPTQYVPFDRRGGMRDSGYCGVALATIFRLGSRPNVQRRP